MGQLDNKNPAVDSTAPEMRTLIDFGLKPWTRSQSLPGPGKVSDPPRAERPLSVEAVPASTRQASGEPIPMTH